METFQRGPFKKYRDGGLIPRPIRRPGRGKSHGKDSIYPTGTTAQLLRLLEMRDEPERFNMDRELWRLWWEGWTVAPDKVKRLLSAKQEAWERALFDFWDAWEQNDEQAISSFKADRLPTYVLGPASGRVGREGFSSLATLVLGMMSGHGAEWFRDTANTGEDAEDLRIMSTALGLNHALDDFDLEERNIFGRELGASFNHFSDAVSPDVLRRCIETTTEADLLHARDELKTLAGTTRNMLSIVEPFIGRKTAGHDLIDIPIKEATTLAQGAMLIWLSLRHRPEWDRLSNVLGDVSIITDLQEQIGIRYTDNQQPPRRLEPSGGMTQGGQSPCPTSLAPPTAPPARDAVS